MVARRERQRRFVMRSVRAATMKRFMLAIVALCMLFLVFAFSMEVGLRAGASVAGNGMMPLGLVFTI